MWKSGDTHRLLIDTAASRLTDVYGLSEHSVTVLATLFHFLDETDRFHPASMRTTILRKELDRAAGTFPAATADASTWRLAKRIFTAMLAEGVDVTDDAAIDAWAAGFSTAPADRRRADPGPVPPPRSRHLPGLHDRTGQSADHPATGERTGRRRGCVDDSATPGRLRPVGR